MHTDDDGLYSGPSTDRDGLYQPPQRAAVPAEESTGSLKTLLLYAAAVLCGLFSFGAFGSFAKMAVDGTLLNAKAEQQGEIMGVLIFAFVLYFVAAKAWKAARWSQLD